MFYKKLLVINLYLIVIFSLSTFCYSQEIENKDDLFFKTSTPEEQGIDSKLLSDMLERIKEKNLKIRSVLIIRNDHLILESYIHPYNRYVTHDVKSVNKSIISSVVGIALRENIIESLNQKVIDLLPGYFPIDVDSLKKEITLAHLLSMSTGLDLDENGLIMREIMSKEDWIKATFERPMVSAPGKQFSYSTFLTHSMSIILTKLSGMRLLDLSNKYLFEPLGIKQVHWEKSPDGYDSGGDKLWITPLAMAKIGYLYLNDGRWGNDQIVPAEWVKESIINRFDEFPDSNFSGYGYWWWLGKDKNYYARGAFGQIISVYPDKDMVMVFTGADNYEWEMLTNNYILPAVKTTNPLPLNPVAEKRIIKMNGELMHPGSQSPPPLPPTAQKISGKKYILEDNDLEFSDITLQFDDPEDCRLIINYQDEILDLAVGLDNVYRVTNKVRWGMKNGDNTFALKGRWLNENKFSIDFQEVGEPFYFDVELEFEEENLKASFTWQPLKWKFLFEGMAE